MAPSDSSGASDVPARRPGAALPGLLLAGGVYLLFGVLTQRTLVGHLGTHVYDQHVPGNDSLLHVWTLAWGQHALATDPARVLHANIFHPYPLTLLYSDHLLGLAVLLAPLRLFTDNVVLVHNLLVLAAPILNGVAMFLLARDLVGRADAAFLAGFLYAFAPLRLEVDRTQVQMLAAWWLPLLLLLARRTITGARPAAAIGTALALLGQGTSSIYLFAFFLPFFLVAHGCWAIAYPPSRHPRGWALLLAGQIVAGTLLLPFFRAYRELQHSLGTVRSPVLSALLSAGHLTGASQALFPFLPLAVLGVGLLMRGRRLPRGSRWTVVGYAALSAGGVLLALGPAIPLPFERGRLWGPYALLAELPGFDALRAPGRMLHMALLGVAILGAFGFTAATARIAPARRRIGLAAVALLAAIDCWTPPFPLLAAPHPAALHPVYAWLARQPDRMRIVELPVDDWPGRTQMRQYAGTLHWRPMLGGNMGILPPAYPYTVRRLRDFPDPAVLAELRALEITHVIIHEREMPPSDRVALARALAAHARWLKRRWSGDGVTVYALRPALRTRPVVLTGVPLSRTDWRVTASHGAGTAPLAIDDSPATAWSSWHGLEDSLRRRWFDPVPFLARWKTFLATQPAQLVLDLGRRHRVTGIGVRFAGTDPLALPHIVVEYSEDGTRWVPFPGALEPLPDVRALVDRAAELPMGIALGSPLVLRYLRLSTSGLEWRVADLAVYGRASS